jgi:hypothetical protein
VIGDGLVIAATRIFGRAAASVRSSCPREEPAGRQTSPLTKPPRRLSAVSPFHPSSRLFGYPAFRIPLKVGRVSGVGISLASATEHLDRRGCHLAPSVCRSFTCA